MRQAAAASQFLARLSDPHAAWESRAEHGLQPMLSGSFPRSVGIFWRMGWQPAFHELPGQGAWNRQVDNRGINRDQGRILDRGLSHQ